MASIVQSATGKALSGTTASATFASAATNGNLLLAFLVTTGPTLSSTGSWNTALNNFGSVLNIYTMYQVLSSAGTTTYSFTLGSSGPWTLVLLEITGQSASPFDVSVAGPDNTNTSPDTGTTATTSQANELWVGCIGYASSTTLTFSGLTAGFTLSAHAEQTGTNGVHNEVVTQFVSATGTAHAAATLSSSVENLGVMLTFKTGSNASIVSSGVVDLGGSGGLAPTGVVTSGVVNMGGSGGLAPVAVVVTSGLITFGTRTISGIAGVISDEVTAAVDLGGSGGLAPTGIASQSLGGSGGLAPVANVVTSIVTMGDVRGGIFIPPPVSSGVVNMGTHGGGQHVTGTQVIISGKVRMGGFALIWNASEGGIAPFYGWIGEPAGQWVLVTVWMWRLGAWKLCPVKRWKTNSWRTL